MRSSSEVSAEAFPTLRLFVGFAARSLIMVKVTKSDPPESKEILAEAIVRIGSAMEALRKSGLNEEAIIVLLHHKTKISKRQIKLIFAAMRQLHGWYCRGKL